MSKNYFKDSLIFLKNRPNRLVAYVAVLAFIVVLYWLSREKMIIFMGIGLAGGLFSWIDD